MLMSQRLLYTWFWVGTALLLIQGLLDASRQHLVWFSEEEALIRP